MARVCIWRDEIDAGVIPAVCMRCGAPDAAWRPHRFSCAPQWVSAFLIVALITACLSPLLFVVFIAVYVALGLALTRRIQLNVPVCDRHAGHWAWRQWFTYAGLAAWFAVGVTGAAIFLSENDRRGTLYEAGTALAAVGGAGVLLWLIAGAAVLQAAIRAKELDDDRLVLVKVSRGFADALADTQDRAEDEYERRRAERHERARRADEFGEEPDPPRERLG